MKIFVSYSRNDADLAERIHEYFATLPKEMGYDIFTDVESIKGGDFWSEVIEENISKCDVFVVIVTHASLSSSEIEREVLLAQKENKTIIPCFHRNVSDEEIKWGLGERQGIKFRREFELARDLFSMIKRTPIPSSSQLPDEPAVRTYTDNSTNTTPQDPPFNQRQHDLQNNGRNQVTKVGRKRRRRGAKIALAIVIIIAVVSLIGYLNSIRLSNDPDDLTNKGYDLVNQGRYEEAIPYFDKALAIDPSHVGALNGKGWAVNGLGNHAQAIQYFDKVLSINPNDIGALNNKGWALNDLSRYEEAMPYLDKALSIDPNYVPALNNKGWALYRLGNNAEAIQQFDKASDIDASNKFAYYGKGLALYDLGNYNQAIDYYDKALNVDPNYLGALNSKALALYSLESYTQAIEMLDKALDIDPNNKYALNGKGWTLYQLGNYRQAIEEFNKALDIDPNDESALNGRSEALSKISQ